MRLLARVPMQVPRRRISALLPLVQQTRSATSAVQRTLLQGLHRGESTGALAAFLSSPRMSADTFEAFRYVADKDGAEASDPAFSEVLRSVWQHLQNNKFTAEQLLFILHELGDMVVAGRLSAKLGPEENALLSKALVEVIKE